MGRTYRVRFFKDLRSKKHGRLNGLTQHDQHRVSLRVGGKIHDDVRTETYLHEALHAILSTGHVVPNDGTSVTEETLVSGLAPHLLHFLRSNPDVVSYLIKGDAK